MGVCHYTASDKNLSESSSVLPKITVFEPGHKLESTYTCTHTHTLTEVLVTEHQECEHMLMKKENKDYCSDTGSGKLPQWSCLYFSL